MYSYRVIESKLMGIKKGRCTLDVRFSRAVRLKEVFVRVFSLIICIEYIECVI